MVSGTARIVERRTSLARSAEIAPAIRRRLYKLHVHERRLSPAEGTGLETERWAQPTAGSNPSPQTMFPKTLHQTWKTKDLSAVPEFAACATSWREHHPGYRHMLWDDRENADFVRSHFPDYFKTWSAFDKNIKRLDSIRYMWMFVFGGIYADLDMECLRPLDGLLAANQDSETILFCDLDAQGNCVTANPALIVSRPGSSLWLDMLEYAKVHRRRYVTRSTGPHALAAVALGQNANRRISFLDQNRLFIRKYDQGFYAGVPGNENDASVYKGVFCTTPKPAKYYEDRIHKYVADWHGTPEQFRWHNEYSSRRRWDTFRTALFGRLRRS